MSSQLALGLKYRDEAFANMDRSQRITAWKETALPMARALIAGPKHCVTADSILAVCPPPPGVARQFVGGWLLGNFRISGDTRTERPTSHGRPIKEFQEKRSSDHGASAPVATDHAGPGAS